MIKLPEFDATRERSDDRFALLNVGLEDNPFCGTLGEFRYQLEGEEDLLHLIVTALESGAEVRPDDARRVASFVLSGVPPALMWFRPGELSGHFYVGHDVLPDHLQF